MVFLLLQGKRVLQRGYPVLEGSESEQLVLCDVAGEVDGAFRRRIGEDEGRHGFDRRYADGSEVAGDQPESGEHAEGSGLAIVLMKGGMVCEVWELPPG